MVEFELVFFSFFFSFSALRNELIPALKRSELFPLIKQQPYLFKH